MAALVVCLPSAHPTTHPSSRSDATEASQAAPFLGKWDLTLHTPAREYAGWLEITRNGGELQGRMVGRWGHAHPVLNLKIENGTLSFASPAREESLPHDMMFEGRLEHGKLSGTTKGPQDAAWTWSGRRAPELARTATPAWGRPVALFNGKSTDGWGFDIPDEASTWTVKDGILTTERRGSDLVTKRKFRDFKLHVEFNCAPQCNSGVYLRGRYEVQIADAAGGVSPDRRAAAIYGYIAPSPAVNLTPGEWMSYDITLIGRTVTVVSNGVTVIDRQTIPGITGGALDSDEGAPGPIYLQGSEKAGATSFRSIVITPAKE